MLKSIGSTWLMHVVMAGSLLVTQPYLKHVFGDPVNIWAVIDGYTAILTLLAFGIPMASSRIFAGAVGRGDREELNAAIGSCASLYVLVGFVAILAGALSYGLYEAAYVPKIQENWPDSVADARLAFVIIVLFMALNFFAQLPNGVMAAHQDFVVSNSVGTGGLILKMVLVLVLLRFVPALSVVAGITLAVPVLEFCVGYAIIRRRYPGVRIRFSDRRRDQLKAIFSFSIWVLLLNLGIKLSFNISGMVLGSFGEINDPFYYYAASRPMIMLITFIVAIGMVAMPRVAQLQAQGAADGIRDVYLHWSKVALSITLIAGTYLMVFGPEFLGSWMSDGAYKTEAGPVLQLLMASCIFFMPVRGVSVGVLIGLGKARAPGLIFIGMGVLNLGLSLILVRENGIMGVALGTAIPNVLFAIVMSGYTCRQLNIPLAHFCSHVGGRCALGAIPVMGVLLVAKQLFPPDSLLLILVYGVAHCILFAAVWILFVYRRDPYVDILARLRGRFTR